MTNETSPAVATFAVACFWGVQDAFDKTEGVTESTAGYMGGTTPNPTYKQVCDGGTGHVEAVQVKYDPNRVSYEALLEVFWAQIPKITLLALDYHTGQYMPVIFHHSEDQRRLAEASRQHLLDSGKIRLGAKLVAIKEATEFWPEPDEYHQHYCRKQGECH